MRRHSAVNAIQCQLCERSFKWESSLNSHVQEGCHLDLRLILNIVRYPVSDS